MLIKDIFLKLNFMLVYVYIFQILIGMVQMFSGRVLFYDKQVVGLNFE